MIDDPPTPLTPDQITILTMTANGYKDKQIALRLNTRPLNISRRLYRIMKKLNAQTREHMTAISVSAYGIKIDLRRIHIAPIDDDKNNRGCCNAD